MLLSILFWISAFFPFLLTFLAATTEIKPPMPAPPPRPVVPPAPPQNPQQVVKTDVKAIQQEEKPIFSIDTNQDIPKLPELDDPTKIDIRYPLIAPYAYAHIHWENAHTELVYTIEEPTLTDQETEILILLEEGIKELINLSFISVKDQRTVLIYLEKNMRILLTEFAIELKMDSYLKIMYYIYRDFVGLNDLDPLMNDYYIEDIECNGLNSPVYIVHRKYRNIRTSLVYTDMHKMASFVEKLAQKAGKYVSYAEPLLDGTLTDGSRVNATYTTDVSSKGPTYCFVEGYLQLGNGNVVQINDFFEKAKKTFGSVVEEGNEIVHLYNETCCGVDAATLVQTHSTLKTVIKLQPPKKLVVLELEDGAKITVTPNHLFHVVDEQLFTLEAEKLQPKMLIPVPTQVQVQGCVQSIPILSLLQEFSYTHKICVRTNAAIYSLVQSTLATKTRKELAQQYNTHEAYFYEILSRGNSISFEVLEQLCQEQNTTIQTLGKLQLVVYGGGTDGKEKAVDVPNTVDVDLAYLAGAIISDGHLSQHSVDISCFNEGFSHAVEQRFEAKFKYTQRYYSGNRVYLSNTFVPYFFNKVFEIPYGKKSTIVKVPKIIFKSDNQIIASFLRGLFDGDGTCKSGLSYKTNSKQLAEELTYLLSRLGIYSYLRTSQHQHKVTIPTPYEQQFYDKINFEDSRKKSDLLRLLQKKISDRVYSRHGRVLAKPYLALMKKSGLSKSIIAKKLNVSYNRMLYYQTFSPVFAQKILNLIPERNDLNQERAYAQWLLQSHQEFVRIKSVDVIENTEKLPVYDIELDPCTFFIAGNKPMNIFDTIRKFTKEPWGPLLLIQKGSTTSDILAYVWMLIEYENSFMVIGGTGTGKTSMLNALAFFIPPQARIVSIEDTRELQLEHENWLPSVSRAGVGLTNILGIKYGEVSLFDLLKASFRQRPDYIIVGEVRGAEAYVLFQAMASGHPSTATMHAENVETLVRRLQTNPINLSGSLVMSLAAVVVMQQTKIKGKEVRKIASVDEIVDVKEVNEGGKVTVNNVFKWEPATDTFKFNPNSRVFQTISEHYGLTKEQVLNEFRLRSALMKEMIRRGVTGYKDVQKTIQEYYKEPKQVLQRYGLVK